MLEDIDFRVKPAIFPVDNREGSKISSGDPQNRHRWTPRSSSPSPLLFFPPYRVDREEIFQRGEGGGKREKEKMGGKKMRRSRGVKRRVVDDGVMRVRS